LTMQPLMRFGVCPPLPAGERSVAQQPGEGSCLGKPNPSPGTAAPFRPLPSGERSGAVASPLGWVAALIVVGLFLAAGCKVPRDVRPQEPSQDLDHEIASSGSVESSVITRTNAERKVAGLRPLIESQQLNEAARRHAADMARRSKLSHELDGKTAADRVKAAGFEFRTVGENIAWNQPTPKAAVDDWMKSRGHRRNLLGEELTHIGVGMATNGKGEPYWVQVFATPR